MLLHMLIVGLVLAWALVLELFWLGWQLFRQISAGLPCKSDHQCCSGLMCGYTGFGTRGLRWNVSW